MTTVDVTKPTVTTRMPRRGKRLPGWAGRLLWCLFGGFVLSQMVGSQEGTINGDFGIAFLQGVGLRHGTGTALHFPVRLFIFFAIGVVLWLLIEFWAVARRYLRRPGFAPLVAGVVGVIIAQAVMNWYDPLAGPNKGGRFSVVKHAVDTGSGLQGTTTAFFDWLAWTLFALVVVLCGAAIVTRMRVLGYLTAAVGVISAVLAYLAHHDVVHVGKQTDHSLGVYADIIAFLVIGAAGLAAVLARSDVADPKAFAFRVMNFRPGLPIAVVAIIFGILAFATDCWFGPGQGQTNASYHQLHSKFSGLGLSSLASQYVAWLGVVLFVVGALLAVAAIWLCHKLLAWVTVVVAVVGVVTTFFTMLSMTKVGVRQVPSFGTKWNNLGVGGYVACTVFAFLGAAVVQVIVANTANTANTADTANAGATRSRPWAKGLPVTKMIDNVRTSSRTKAFVVVGLAIALFYPPMLTQTWQNTLVTQIGPFLLLAVGLNVVVGWAGLLDLGYIAFYAIGSYTTAYFTGSLPKKPPSWLHLSPLACIPFAIIACLIAGVILGAPTLRLRGDYLAIVTLGFGEIITVVAVNDPGGLTGGPQGPTVPHPKFNLFGLHLKWGQDNLPYWYLLLVMLVVVLVLFYRLEGSRLGRAWAAIREDEVAAQASGVNTTRVKLLAFAIGASTSGLAGVFFATQVGYFDPSLFGIQASILIVAYVVFGGMGSLPGALAGAAVLTWLPQFLKDQVPQNDRQMWIGAAVLAMMIFRPAGLLPAKRRRAELEGLDSPASSEVSAVPASEGL